MKLAAACYPIDWIWGYLGLVEKYDVWVADAARAGAQLLVFPEYGAMELAGLAGEAVARDLARSIQAVSQLLPEYWEMCAVLARRHGVHILAGSGPWRDGARLVNRAMFFGPEGGRQPHDKQMPTARERAPMGLVPGAPLTLMETALGRIGVLICNDAEDPALARALVEAGAQVLLIPSQTEAGAGYNRVRLAAMARAVESQCVTLQAVTQGDAGWTPVVGENCGAAGIYAPPGAGFAATGVIACGEMNRPGWTFGTVDLGAIRRARADRNPRSFAEWTESSTSVQCVQTIVLA